MVPRPSTTAAEVVVEVGRQVDALPVVRGAGVLVSVVVGVDEHVDYVRGVGVLVVVVLGLGGGGGEDGGDAEGEEDGGEFHFVSFFGLSFFVCLAWVTGLRLFVVGGEKEDD